MVYLYVKLNRILHRFYLKFFVIGYGTVLFRISIEEERESKDY